MKRLLILIYLLVPLLGVAQESRSTLKGYFETGDIPTQTQFESLIDSHWNFIDDGVLDSTIVYDSLADHRTLLDAHADSIDDLRLDIGSGGSTSWGSITGTLSDQTDVANAINLKASTSAVWLRNGGNFALGGDMTITYTNRTWEMSNNNASGLTIKGDSIRFSSSDGLLLNHFTVNTGGARWISQNSHPIVYDGDYSANYTARSLTDKAYVDTGDAAVEQLVINLQRQIQILQLVLYVIGLLIISYLVSRFLPKKLPKLNPSIYKLKSMFNK